MTRGTVYVKIRAYSSRRTGSYRLVSSFTASGGSSSGGSSLGGSSSRDDHGNTTSRATRVNASSTTSGRIERGGDYDYFRIDIPSSGTLTVNSTGSLDTFGYLLDSNGRTLTSNDDSGSGTNFRISRAVTRGTVYVKVRAYSRSRTGSYRFVSFFTSSEGDSTNENRGIFTNLTYAPRSYRSTFSVVSDLLNGRITPTSTLERNILAYANPNGINEQTGEISNTYDSTWGDRLNFNNSFNTVYNADVGLDNTGIFEVVSIVDELGPVSKTFNRNVYFFSYDGLNDGRGNAITINEWVDYLEEISRRYGRIGRLTIYAHGNSGSIGMSQNFRLSTDAYEQNINATNSSIESNINIQNQLRRLQNILTENATILLFPCLVASSTIEFSNPRNNITIPNNGINFVQTLANLTGATVYANTQSTGDSIFNGVPTGFDWDLDVVKRPQ